MNDACMIGFLVPSKLGCFMLFFPPSVSCGSASSFQFHYILTAVSAEIVQIIDQFPCQTHCSCYMSDVHFIHISSTPIFQYIGSHRCRDLGAV